MSYAAPTQSKDIDAAPAVLAALEVTFPRTLANTLLMVARQRSNQIAGQLSGPKLSSVLAALEGSLAAYLADAEKRLRCVSALQRVGAEYGALLATESVPWIILLGSERDLPVVTEAARTCAQHTGMSVLGQTKLMTATAELARNIVQYAGSGEVHFATFTAPSRGVLVVAIDRGPGIPDIEKVMSPKYVSKTGMGIGLQGAKRLADEFAIECKPGKGTTVRLRKYA
jgi:serine/threonine-protein kinase RsbT